MTKELDEAATNHALNVGTPSAIDNVHKVIEAKRLAYIAGATFATNITFERVVEALRDDWHRHGDSWDWLIENREKILGGKE